MRALLNYLIRNTPENLTGGYTMVNIIARPVIGPTAYHGINIPGRQMRMTYSGRRKRKGSGEYDYSRDTTPSTPSLDTPFVATRSKILRRRFTPHSSPSSSMSLPLVLRLHSSRPSHASTIQVSESYIPSGLLLISVIR